MDSIEQMEAQLDQVLTYCNAHEGLRDDVFPGIRDTIIEYRRHRTQDERRETLTTTYFDVISTLLLAADPPHEGSYSRVLEELSKLTGTTIETVLFDTDTSLEAHESRAWSLLVADLPKRRTFTPEERETIDHFRSSLYDTSFD